LIKQPTRRLRIAAGQETCNNWRRFSGLNALPKPRLDHDCIPELFNTSPVACLLWLACAMSTENLVKVLKLVDLALTRSSDEKKTLEKVASGTSSDDQDENRVVITQNTSIALPGLSYKSPEDMLSFSIDDAHAFAMRFVCKGSTVRSTIGLQRCSKDLPPWNRRKLDNYSKASHCIRCAKVERWGRIM
jgi:hypothetical protein